MSLVAQRCFTHQSRGASGRCPGCIRFYCRECLTEHEGRVLCTRCLHALNRPALLPKIGAGGWSMRLVGAVLGLFAGYLFFLLIGRLFLFLPPSFHDGSALTGLFK